ncbi:F0F1 ATP synthase subunit A [Rubrobacter xylanophilus]|uniref:F0F1 ATP synthase subunit A n=1 Tax=Rubrobacter xylanophilus TaxID=49319 RepID=UPI000055054F|nr:F0F1 ATP synthase subunit A [Rubrobacter xylanophilus]
MTTFLALLEVTQEELRHEILHTWEAAREAWVIHLEIAGINLSINKPVWFLWLGAAITFLFMYVGARTLRDRPGAYQVLVEELFRFGRDMFGGQINEEGRKWFPYSLTLFIFLLVLNIIGLFPNSYPVTSNISFTATLALFTFVLTQYEGVRRNGLVTYLKSWAPADLPAKPLMYPIMWFLHLIQEFTKPLTLALRLYANILAGHLIIFVFLSLILYFGLPTAFVSVPFAVVFYAFEIFVAVIQAYIFAILTQVYIELAMFAEEAH